MQVNRIQNNNYNSQPNFGAVKFSKSVKKYPELMETLIESPYVRKFIAENEARGIDTDIHVNTDNPSLRRYGSRFKIESSDSFPKILMDTDRSVSGIINEIKFQDSMMRLPEKMKKFEEWVSSLSKKS